ncbi:PepSY-associated TM helix domain-containing protein [Undibacterium danionis]|uniref:PepSY-associated TM helix domain-containing protein n=1 Tax=Undibacterium danionis TaxID=1812100 RepID=A0ABV6IET7_9BURK
MKIRSDILRVYQSLHTWVGITAGVFLFIAFFAGALTMFKQPIDAWMQTPVQELKGVPETQLDQLVSQVLQQHPKAKNNFQIHLDDEHHATVTWIEGKSGRELDLNEKRWGATLDAQGQLISRQETPSKLAELIDMLHRTAGVPGMLDDEHLGVYFMGIASVLYFLALVSGVILLLPTLVKDFFALRSGKNRKRFWLDAHNIVGITSLPFHLVICLTAIVFAFHDQYYDALNNFIYPSDKIVKTKKASPQKLEPLAPSILLANIRREANNAAIHELEFMGLDGGRPMLRVGLNNPRYLVRGAETGYLILNPFNGKTTSTSMVPGKESTWMAIIVPFFSLHFGSFGGDFMRWVYFFFGLSGAFLFYSGNLLWLEKRRKTQGQQTRSNRWMAAATVGICLGSIAAVMSCLLAGQWFYQTQSNINSLFISSYYSVFLIALAWSFWRGAASASVHLLWLNSILCFAIPLSSVLQGKSMNLIIDLVAFAASLLFAYAAFKTAKRVQHGTKDSVWARG